jgi:hypothetical protein
MRRMKYHGKTIADFVGVKDAGAETVTKSERQTLNLGMTVHPELTQLPLFNRSEEDATQLVQLEGPEAEQVEQEGSHVTQDDDLVS